MSISLSIYHKHKAYPSTAANDGSYWIGTQEKPGNGFGVFEHLNHWRLEGFFHNDGTLSEGYFKRIDFLSDRQFEGIIDRSKPDRCKGIESKYSDGQLIKQGVWNSDKLLSL